MAGSKGLGRVHITLDTLAGIAGALGVRVKDLFEEEYGLGGMPAGQEALRPIQRVLSRPIYRPDLS